MNIVQAFQCNFFKTSVPKNDNYGKNIKRRLREVLDTLKKLHVDDENIK